jgi:hypothetical protein
LGSFLSGDKCIHSSLRKKWITIILPKQNMFGSFWCLVYLPWMAHVLPFLFSY